MVEQYVLRMKGFKARGGVGFLGFKIGSSGSNAAENAISTELRC